MSEVKRYNPKLEKDIGLGLPCLTMKENFIGSWVRYEDYAALQQKLDAMAAENAALKKSNPNLKTVGYLAHLIGKLASMDYHPLRPVDYRISDINAWLRNYHDNKTPDTDAYLNSVRAEGVDMVAEAIGNSAAKLKAGSKDWKSLKSIVFTLVNFAAQLRSGTHDTADKAG